MPKNILIVDDSLAIASALTTLFQQAGYNVSTAYSGQEALVALSSKPDLVVLDILIPDMDGYDICRHIRQAEGYTPILMLTALSDSTAKVLGLELGADAYITKPFEPTELLAQMRALFRILEKGTGALRERALLCGSLCMWEAQHRVDRDGEEIDLTPTEFGLLRLLMQCQGHVVGREALLREVWGYDFDGDTRTVDVHIQRLRAKIEPDPANPRYLHTVRGFGYKLYTEMEK